MKRHAAPALILAAYLVAIGVFTWAGGITGFCLFAGVVSPLLEAAMLSAHRHG